MRWSGPRWSNSQATVAAHPLRVRSVRAITTCGAAAHRDVIRHESEIRVGRFDSRRPGVGVTNRKGRGSSVVKLIA